MFKPSFCGLSPGGVYVLYVATYTGLLELPLETTPQTARPWSLSGAASANSTASAAALPPVCAARSPVRSGLSATDALLPTLRIVARQRPNVCCHGASPRACGRRRAATLDAVASRARAAVARAAATSSPPRSASSHRRVGKCQPPAAKRPGSLSKESLLGPPNAP